MPKHDFIAFRQSPQHLTASHALEMYTPAHPRAGTGRPPPYKPPGALLMIMDAQIVRFSPSRSAHA
jgi:hypothetical protein